MNHIAESEIIKLSYYLGNRFSLTRGYKRNKKKTTVLFSIKFCKQLCVLSFDTVRVTTCLENVSRKREARISVVWFSRTPHVTNARQRSTRLKRAPKKEQKERFKGNVTIVVYKRPRKHVSHDTNSFRLSWIKRTFCNILALTSKLLYFSSELLYFSLISVSAIFTRFVVCTFAIFWHEKINTIQWQIWLSQN